MVACGDAETHVGRINILIWDHHMAMHGNCVANDSVYAFVQVIGSQARLGVYVFCEPPCTCLHSCGEIFCHGDCITARGEAICSNSI